MKTLTDDFYLVICSKWKFEFDHIKRLLKFTSLYMKRLSLYLQKQEGNFSLTAKFDEMGSFHCGLGEEDPVVADDADGEAVQTGKSRHLKTNKFISYELLQFEVK